jgi:hypothetical protein
MRSFIKCALHHISRDMGDGKVCRMIAGEFEGRRTTRNTQV